jgi:uncharacterized protein (TIGR03382 family)
MHKSSFAAVLTLALAASISLAQEARAVPPQPLSGYVTDLNISLATRDDSTSAIACQWKPVNPRSPGVRYKKAQHLLFVQITSVPKGPIAEMGKPFADPTKGNVVVVLKDAAGATIDTQPPFGNTVSFTKLGAEVCVQAPEEETDAGAADVGGDAGPKLVELCKPVTITSLEVTPAEQAAHEAAVAAECAMYTDAGTSGSSSGGSGASGSSGASGNTSGGTSGGTSGNTSGSSSSASGVIASGSTSSGGSGMANPSSTGGATTTEGGGCNTSGSTGAAPALGLLAILGVVLRRRATKTSHR